MVTFSGDLSKAGGKLANLGELINSTEKHVGLRVAENYQEYNLKFVSEGADTVAQHDKLVSGRTSETGGGRTIDPLKSLSGLTEVVLHPDAAKFAKGVLNGVNAAEYSSDGQPLGVTDATVLGHEFGHAWGMVMLGHGFPHRRTLEQIVKSNRAAIDEANVQESLAWENYFRDRDPELQGRHRKRH